MEKFSKATMDKIQTIESEIDALQAEIDKLENRHRELSQEVSPSIDGSSSEKLLATIETAANLVAERRKQMQIIGQAIAHLKEQLSPKLEALQQLKREQERQAAQQRVEVAQSKIRDTVEKIKAIAADLESEYWDLKEHYKEFNADYRAAQLPGSSSGWNPADLIKFRNLPLPQVVEQGDRFIIEARFVDPFKPEKDAAELAHRRASAANKQNRQQAWEAQQKKEAEQLRRLEAQRLGQVLDDKRSQLNSIERQKKELISSGATVGKGLGYKIDPQTDNRIAGLKSEIAKIEAEIEQLQQQQEAAA